MKIWVIIWTNHPSYSAKEITRRRQAKANPKTVSSNGLNPVQREINCPDQCFVRRNRGNYPGKARNRWAVPVLRIWVPHPVNINDHPIPGLNWASFQGKARAFEEIPNNGQWHLNPQDPFRQGNPQIHRNAEEIRYLNPCTLRSKRQPPSCCEGIRRG